MALELRTKDVVAVLTQADQLASAQGDSLLGAYTFWADRLRLLLNPATPLTYLPILVVCLVARTIDDTVDVRRIQKGDEYSAALVGRAVTDYGREHHIDMRTDSTNVMNSQPFIRQPAITSGLSDTPAYASFYEAVEKAQALTSTEAAEVLALALHLGRQNWPHRQRRVQRNQVHQQPALPSLGHMPDESTSCFILNQSPHEDFQHYDGEGYYGFHERVTSAKALVSAGGGRFVYYRTSDAKDSPMHFVGSGRITEVEEQEPDADGRRTWRAQIEDYEPFPTPVPKAEGAPHRWNVQHSIALVSAEAFDRILRLGQGLETPQGQPLTVADLRAACLDRGLAVDDHVLASLVGALDSGKHVILTGPPGTAKTTLAVLVARLAALNGLSSGHTLATATADWSTYDTIGGLTPRSDGTLAFRYGVFLQALEGNRWLIVDELNRSNFDRAFGPLFTVLAGQDVVLQHHHDDRSTPAGAAPEGPADHPQGPAAPGGAGSRPGRLVRLRIEGHPEDEDYHDIVVRRSWRMLATINNFDKSLLFEMSFALMRRFAFVEVPAPSDQAYLDLAARELAGEAEDVAEPARKVVADLLPLRHIRQVGPAVYLDAARMARSMLATSDLAPAEVTLRVFYALLLPQFEGVEEAQGRRLMTELRRAVGVGQTDEARRMLREVLGLDLGRSTEQAEEDETELLDASAPDVGAAGSEGPDEAPRP